MSHAAAQQRYRERARRAGVRFSNGKVIYPPGYVKRQRRKSVVKKDDSDLDAKALLWLQEKGLR